LTRPARQAGWPIQKAKETMRHCIQNLNPGDTFQLIGFNTEIFPCFPAPVRATPETIRKALAFLAPIEGRGGTDISRALTTRSRSPTIPTGCASSAI
jgi:Ca-activated chloride channel family protein